MIRKLELVEFESLPEGQRFTCMITRSRFGTDGVKYAKYGTQAVRLHENGEPYRNDKGELEPENIRDEVVGVWKEVRYL